MAASVPAVLSAGNGSTSTGSLSAPSDRAAVFAAGVTCATAAAYVVVAAFAAGAGLAGGGLCAPAAGSGPRVTAVGEATGLAVTEARGRGGASSAGICRCQDGMVGVGAAGNCRLLSISDLSELTSEATVADAVAVVSSALSR